MLQDHKLRGEFLPLAQLYSLEIKIEILISDVEINKILIPFSRQCFKHCMYNPRVANHTNTNYRNFATSLSTKTDSYFTSSLIASMATLEVF